MLNQNEGIWQLVAKAIGYDLSMSLNCLLWRGGGMVDTKDFEKLSLLLFGNLKINAYICV